MKQLTRAALNKICYSYLQRGLFLKIFSLFLLKRETIPQHVPNILFQTISKSFAYPVPDLFIQICLPRLELTMEPCTSFYPGNALHSSPDRGVATGAPWARVTNNVKKPQNQMCESFRKLDLKFCKTKLKHLWFQSHI